MSMLQGFRFSLPLVFLFSSVCPFFAPYFTPCFDPRDNWPDRGNAYVDFDPKYSIPSFDGVW